MLDLAAYEAGVHELCGLHHSVAMKDPDLQIESEKCPICAGIEQYQRVQAAEDQQARKALGDPPPPAAPDPADGRRLSLRHTPTNDAPGG